MRRLELPLLLLAATWLPACDGLGTAPVAQSVARRAVDSMVEPAWASAVEANPNAVADVAEAAVNAVVHIQSERDVEEAPQAQMMPYFFGMPGMQGPQGMQGVPGHGGGHHYERGVGSGVIVDAKGLILTNNHVVEGADSLTVTLADGRKLVAKVRATDPDTDVALVELQGEVPKDLPSLSFGDSDHLRLGQTVLAIGSPFALQGSVTMGIVSARSRHVQDLASYSDYLQTDAAINPGNSGGALVSLDGKLVGINSAIASESGGYDGIGFAIPSNLAKDIMERLLRDGHVVRGFLGVAPADLDPAAADMLGLGDRHGAIVSQVTPGTPADKAGLKPYDVIVAVDGAPIDGAADLRNTISLKGAHVAVALDVLRDGQPQRLTATLEELKDKGKGGRADAPDTEASLLRGVTVAALNDAIRQELGADAQTTGVVVTAVTPGCDAAMAGLQPGDILLEVDRKPVSSIDDLKRALKGKERGMLLVQRGGYRQILFVD